jgi:mannose-1-phosphate guanylyltransferase
MTAKGSGPASGVANMGSVWSIVLAGGEGSRLRPLVRRIHPDGRPKQFAVIVGSRSLLRHTLDRSALLVPTRRTVVVTTRSHVRYFASDLSGPSVPHVLVQPFNCGTAAGVLLPAHWISWRDPGATIVIFPSDHFIADDDAFIARVGGLADAARRHPGRIFLLGAEPDSAESGYGWIEPGRKLENADGLRLVERFREKPARPEAEACLRRGGLWNTFVMASSVGGMLAAGRDALPELHERLAAIRPFTGTTAEDAALERAYAGLPVTDFSRSVLATRTAALAVGRLPKRTWSDWGTPERVIQTLHRRGIAPAWLAHLAPTA